MALLYFRLFKEYEVTFYDAISTFFVAFSSHTAAPEPLQSSLRLRGGCAHWNCFFAQDSLSCITFASFF